MPIYLFVCEVCGREVEELRSMGDDTAPALEGPCTKTSVCKMVRRITAPGLNFVGPGWGGCQTTSDGNFDVKTSKGKRKFERWGKTKKVSSEK